MNLRYIIAFALVLSLAPPASAIVTSDVAGSHVVAPGEITFGLNLDGVARIHIDDPDFPDFSFTLATAALVSDRHLLTAAHVFDIDNDGTVDPSLPDFPPTLVTFDLAGGPYQATISHDRVRVMPGWIDAWHDLVIIELDRPVPSAIPRYRCLDCMTKSAGPRCSRAMVLPVMAAAAPSRTCKRQSAPA